MSRQPQRSLTLTEELERIEQQITLTLQEIDSNFSKAHRIVTSGILPAVEQYGKHSSQVWESSEYWKQFFESAANVSLSSYEEAAIEDESLNKTEISETNVVESTENENGQNETDHDFTIDSPTHTPGSQSTPKAKHIPKSPAAAVVKSPAFRSPSPRKYTGRNPLAQDDPSTPGAHGSQFSSPFRQDSASRSADRKENHDPLLHRSVLDKNYRVAPTPFKIRSIQQKAEPASSTTPTTTRKPWEDSPDSSPEISAPQLRSELFSPAKIINNRTAPRTPGVSVQKTVKYSANAPITSTGRKLFSADDKALHTNEQKPMYNFSKFEAAADEYDDEDESFDMSPPKTLQFHVPQSRLLQTPAREASKKIVDDLLASAGIGGDTTSEMEAFSDEEASLDVVQDRYQQDSSF